MLKMSPFASSDSIRKSCKALNQEHPMLFIPSATQRSPTAPTHRIHQYLIQPPQNISQELVPKWSGPGGAGRGSEAKPAPSSSRTETSPSAATRWRSLSGCLANTVSPPSDGPAKYEGKGRQTLSAALPRARLLLYLNECGY